MLPPTELLSACRVHAADDAQTTSALDEDRSRSKRHQQRIHRTSPVRIVDPVRHQRIRHGPVRRDPRGESSRTRDSLRRPRAAFGRCPRSWDRTLRSTCSARIALAWPVSGRHRARPPAASVHVQRTGKTAFTHAAYDSKHRNEQPSEPMRTSITGHLSGIIADDIQGRTSPEHDDLVLGHPPASRSRRSARVRTEPGLHRRGPRAVGVDGTPRWGKPHERARWRLESRASAAIGFFFFFFPARGVVASGVWHGGAAQASWPDHTRGGGNLIDFSETGQGCAEGLRAARRGERERERERDNDGGTTVVDELQNRDGTSERGKYGPRLVDIGGRTYPRRGGSSRQTELPFRRSVWVSSNTVPTMEDDQVGSELGGGPSKVDPVRYESRSSRVVSSGPWSSG